MEGVPRGGHLPAADATALLADINRWVLAELPRLNRAILDGNEVPDELRRHFIHSVLRHLPDPALLSPAAAQRLVVLLGLSGASIARHFQEADPSHRAVPEHAFDGLHTGPLGLPFVSYFAGLADRTGTGHCHRDSFASLVRWNVPKGSEVLEAAVNGLLLPLSDGSLDLATAEAIERVTQATALLVVMRRLNAGFTALPPAKGLRVSHFMDVFRQYAVHWQHGDAPPSGAMDPQALGRDLLLGIALPGYADSLRRIFPGLLADERGWLETLIGRPSVVELALARAGIDPNGLAEASPTTLAQLTDRHPILAALHLLLNAHARFAGVHLMMTKRFLFNPQRERDADGRGDPGVVSNRIGTTGMDERRLESLTHARKEHVLAPLHHLPMARLEAGLQGIVDLPGLRRRTDQEYLQTVRFVGAPGTDLGLPDADHPLESDDLRHRRSADAQLSIPVQRSAPAVPEDGAEPMAIVKGV
jgi:hypothetical protein